MTMLGLSVLEGNTYKAAKLEVNFSELFELEDREGCKIRMPTYHWT